MPEPIKATTVTFARLNFEAAMRDVARLVQLHDAGVRERRGPPSPDLEVFKRAGLILAVTAWESFVEDTLTSAFKNRLRSAKTPKDVLETFHAVAHSWLSQPRRPPELVAWTGDNWKSMLGERADQEVAELNTPNSANVARLTRRLLGQDVTSHWFWPGTSAASAKARLDQVIVLRGKLVHRTKVFHDRRASVRRRDVAAAISLLTRLMERTEKTLGLEPKEVTFDRR